MAAGLLIFIGLHPRIITEGFEAAKSEALKVMEYGLDLPVILSLDETLTQHAYIIQPFNSPHN